MLKLFESEVKFFQTVANPWRIFHVTARKQPIDKSSFWLCLILNWKIMYHMVCSKYLWFYLSGCFGDIAVKMKWRAQWRWQLWNPCNTNNRWLWIFTFGQDLSSYTFFSLPDNIFWFWFYKYWHKEFSGHPYGDWEAFLNWPISFVVRGKCFSPSEYAKCWILITSFRVSLKAELTTFLSASWA